MFRAAAVSILSVALAACTTLDSPDLDEHTLTTENGVRFRTGSGFDGECSTASHIDPVGWGLSPSTVEQNGRVRRNPKFNFASQSDDLNDVAVRGAHRVVEDFYDDAILACALWQLAAEEQKSSHLTYFQDAIKGSFEAATRFEAAARVSRDALLAEAEVMRAKYQALITRRPTSLSLKDCWLTRVLVTHHLCTIWFPDEQG